MKKLILPWLAFWLGIGAVGGAAIRGDVLLAVLSVGLSLASVGVMLYILRPSKEDE